MAPGILAEVSQYHLPNFSPTLAGVLTGKCCAQLDHAVTAEGYGTSSSGQDYYYIKNSWGTDWGANGYIFIGRGASFGTGGMCGIQEDSSYPLKNN